MCHLLSCRKDDGILGNSDLKFCIAMTFIWVHTQMMMIGFTKSGVAPDCKSEMGLLIRFENEDQRLGVRPTGKSFRVLRAE